MSSGQSRIISALNSAGDSLTIINRKDEPGFGLIWDQPLIPGVPDSVEISFECKAVSTQWDIYYIDGQTSWYPENITLDRATYKTTYDCPKNLQVIGCGDEIESHIDGKRLISTWELKNQVAYVSFNIGTFYSKEVIAQATLSSVEVYISKYFSHEEMALYLNYLGIPSEFR